MRLLYDKPMSSKKCLYTKEIVHGKGRCKKRQKSEYRKENQDQLELQVDGLNMILCYILRQFCSFHEPLGIHPTFPSERKDEKNTIWLRIRSRGVRYYLVLHQNPIAHTQKKGVIRVNVQIQLQHESSESKNSGAHPHPSVHAQRRRGTSDSWLARR